MPFAAFSQHLACSRVRCCQAKYHVWMSVHRVLLVSLLLRLIFHRMWFPTSKWKSRPHRWWWKRRRKNRMKRIERNSRLRFWLLIRLNFVVAIVAYITFAQNGTQPEASTSVSPFSLAYTAQPTSHAYSRRKREREIRHRRKRDWASVGGGEGEGVKDGEKISCNQCSAEETKNEWK